MFYIAQYFPITDPTLIFFVVLMMILLSPIIMGRLRIPYIIGMVLAGVLVGEYGLNILKRDASFELFGSVGLYYIMFLAGLEMDMEGLKKNKWRVLSFGLLANVVFAAWLYYVVEHTRCLSDSGSLRSFAASCIYAQRWGDNGVAVFGTCYYGDDSKLVSRWQRWRVLAVVYAEVCALFGRSCLLYSTPYSVVSAPLCRCSNAVSLRFGRAVLFCSPVRCHWIGGNLRCFLLWTYTKPFHSAPFTADEPYRIYG